MNKYALPLIFVFAGVILGIVIGQFGLNRSITSTEGSSTVTPTQLIFPTATTNQSDLPIEGSNHPVMGNQDDTVFAYQLGAQAFMTLDLQYDTALLLAVEASRLADTSTTRGNLLFALRHLPELAAVVPDSRWAEDLAFSPDGKWLAAAFNGGRILVYDVATGQPINQTYTGLINDGGEEQLHASVAFSPDSRWLVGTNPYFSDSVEDKRIAVWDVMSGKLVVASNEQVGALAFTPDGQHLITSSFTAIVYWQIVGDQLIELSRLDLEIEDYRAPKLAIHPDGQWVAVGIPSQKVILWNFINNKPEELLLDSYGHGLAFNHDGSLLALESNDDVILWQVEEKQSREDSLLEAGRVIGFSEDGLTLLTASRHEESFKLWKIEPERSYSWSKPIHAWGYTETPLAAAFHPNGYIVATSSEANNIILWDTTTLAHMGWELVPQPSGLRDIQFVGDEATLGIYERNDTLSFWNVVTGEQISSRPGFAPLEAESYRFNRDFTVAAISNFDDDPHTILLGNPRTGEMIGEPIVVENTISYVALDPQGKTLALTDNDQHVSLWNVATQQILITLPVAVNERVITLAFSPDGHTLAVATGYYGSSSHYINQITLWDTQTYQSVLPPILTDINNLYFSPDGRFLISEAYARWGLTLWDVTTGEQVTTLGSSLSGAVHFAAFQPEGTFVALHNLGYVNYGSRLHTVSLMDSRTYQEIAGGVSFIYYVSPLFSPNGKFLVMMNNMGQWVVWDMALETWQEAACRKANRNLTEREWNLYMGDVLYRKTCPHLP